MRFAVAMPPMLERSKFHDGPGDGPALVFLAQAVFDGNPDIVKKTSLNK